MAQYNLGFPISDQRCCYTTVHLPWGNTRFGGKQTCQHLRGRSKPLAADKIAGIPHQQAKCARAGESGIAEILARSPASSVALCLRVSVVGLECTLRELRKDTSALGVRLC